MCVNALRISTKVITHDPQLPVVLRFPGDASFEWGRRSLTAISEDRSFSSSVREFTELYSVTVDSGTDEPI